MANGDPFQVRRMARSGTGDMGDVTDEASVCRFSLALPTWEVVYVLGQATGGTGIGDVSIKVRHADDPSNLRNFLVMTIPDFGSAGTDSKPDFYVRIAPHEREQWQFTRGDLVVLEWTNPDPSNMRWSVELGARRAGNFSGT